MIKATSCGGVVIFRGKILLLYKNYKKRYDGWVLPKGTVEEGEEYKETALREVKEETGVDVEHLHYYKCQPWAFSSTMLFGFFCRVKGDDRITLDENELKEATWAERTDDIESPDNSSLTSEMIRLFRKGMVSFDEL